MNPQGYQVKVIDCVAGAGGLFTVNVNSTNAEQMYNIFQPSMIGGMEMYPGIVEETYGDPSNTNELFYYLKNYQGLPLSEIRYIPESRLFGPKTFKAIGNGSVPLADGTPFKMFIVLWD